MADENKLMVYVGYAILIFLVIVIAYFLLR